MKLPRLLFVAITLASLYLWLRLTDPKDPAAFPFTADARGRMELNRVNGRQWITVEERVT